MQSKSREDFNAQSLRTISTHDGVRVYEIASQKHNPSWAIEKKKPSRKLRKQEDYQRRIELVQDLEFPTAAQKAKISEDGEYLIVSGSHPPQFKCFDLKNLSCKFTRHLEAEVVDFQVLSEDYGKIAFLCADRAIRFHAKFGNYYDVRTPRQGRDIAMSKRTSDLIVVGSSKDVYRLNLEKGRFLAPLEAKCEDLNCCGISPSHGLVAVGGGDGSVECFDLRQKRSVGRMHACGANDYDSTMEMSDSEDAVGVTALRFDQSGLNLACGSSDGIVRIFDLRSSRAKTTKDHMYGEAIVDIKFHETADGSKRVMSTDKKIVKVWDQNSGENYVAIEPRDGKEINDIVSWENSGLIFTICDDPKIGCYFVPGLGPAPKWCSFLENLTEEMEEQKRETLYDDYRFVTLEELNTLGLEHLIGTKMLKAYMHGFFMDNRLYGKAKSVSNPFSYEDYKNKKIAETMEKERQSRIAPKKKLKMPKVNAAFAAKLASGEKMASFKTGDADADADNEDLEGTPGIKNELMRDDRFGALFKDEDFEIDERSEHYKLLHPNAANVDARRKRELIEEHFDTFDSSDDEDNDKNTTTKRVKKNRLDRIVDKMKEEEEEDDKDVDANADDGEKRDGDNKKFIRASAFAGAKKGYIFSNGDRGVGYYLDDDSTKKAKPSLTDKKSLKKKTTTRTTTSTNKKNNDDDDVNDKKRNINEPRMYSVKDAFHKSAFEKNQKSNINLPLFERAKIEGGSAKTLEDAERRNVKKTIGNREAMFDASALSARGKKLDKKRLTGFGIRDAADDDDEQQQFPAETHYKNGKRRGAEPLMSSAGRGRGGRGRGGRGRGGGGGRSASAGRGRGGGRGRGRGRA